VIITAPTSRVSKAPTALIFKASHVGIRTPGRLATRIRDIEVIGPGPYGIAALSLLQVQLGSAP